MPPRGVTREKNKEMYEHIKQSYLDRGKSEEEAEEIAARTVNEYKAEHGQTEEDEESE